MKIKFFIPGNPKSLKRHRTAGLRCGEPWEYNPSKGDKADFLAKALQHRPETPFNGPLFVKMTFKFSRPKCHYRTGKYSHLLKDNAPHHVTGTPDLDNMIKFVGDALDGIFWTNDKIICGLYAEKSYGDSPGVSIEINAKLP